MSKTSVVVTGLAWMGAGIGSIESALQRLFTSAKSEGILVSGAPEMQELAELLGVRFGK